MKPDRALASRLWVEGLEQEAGFAFDSAIVLFRKATRADPQFLPAYFDQLRLLRHKGNPLPFRAELEARADLSAGDRRCLLAVARTFDDASVRWIHRFRAMRTELGDTPCVQFGLARALKSHSPSRVPPGDEELDAARGVARAFPEHPETLGQLVGTLERMQRLREALAVASDGAAKSPHIIPRQSIRAFAVRLATNLKDTTGARVLYGEMLADARRDGRPWVLHECLTHQWAIAPPGRPGSTPHAEEQLRVGRTLPGRYIQVWNSISQAQQLVEAGQMNEVLALLQPHASYVDRNDLVFLAMRLHHLEGRALVRSGRPAEALPVLAKALRAAERLGALQYVAESNHQLTHAYEGLRDWPRAARASERFIAAAQETPDPAVRVVSYSDAAAVHWKAGWHAAADSLSRRMVAAIEREGVHYVFGAEYFERIGDFGSAMSFLRRASVPANGQVVDANFLYAGLTRLHLALGNTDSALAAATSHDSLPWTFDELLVPRVLVARGEHARAVAAMRRWTEFQAERGNVRAQVKALVALAEMLLLGAPAEAQRAAHEAEDLARTNAFTLEAIVARRVRGQAASRTGSEDALPLLESARAMALEHPDMMQRVLTEVALGDARLAAGRATDALSAFRAAVGLVERSAVTLEGEVGVARFRAARVQAFDGALRATLASSAAGLADSVLRWSARKKTSVAGRPAVRPSAMAIGASLAADEALIDYVVVDTAVWTTVVTRGGASLHRLPISPERALALSRRVVSPITSVFAGRVDLARAPFDVDAAHRLWAALLAPIAPRLAAARHLVIVPDAPLHSVPFDALVTANVAGRPTFVLDRVSVRIAHTPGTVRRESLRVDKLLLVVGDAPGAAVERQRLAEQWGGRVEVLEGARGSESSVLRRAAAHRVLHFATHASSSGQDPLASFLALAKDAANDGLLHYAEIEKLRAPRALVVLNACETSTGELLAGSGFMSLARAFLVSGAASVVATQWPVGAASGTLSARFYERVRAGAPLHVALRDAKLALRNDPATAHPFFWASHVLLHGY